jgi:signal transduction histidine kinase
MGEMKPASLDSTPLDESAATQAPVSRSANIRSAHVVQFYAQDSFLLDELARFIGSALEAGDAALVIATRAHRDGLAQLLSARGLDATKATADGRYIVLDAAETLGKFMVEGYPNAAQFAELMSGYMKRAQHGVGGEQRAIAAFGEMVTLLWKEGKSEAAIRLEHLWNELARTHTFSLRCAYSMEGFSRGEHRESFLKICESHSDVIPAEGYTSLHSKADQHRKIAQLQQNEQAHTTLQQIKQELDGEIAERIATERKLRASEKSLRELSGHLLRMQDEERRRLGRELHDSFGQYLAALKMSLDMLAMSLNSPDGAAKKHLADCVRLVDQSLTEVRTISYLLYPPMLEEMGLKTAIPWYLDGFTKRSGIQTSLDISNACGRMPRDVELAIFRILQESLTNVHRHSGGRQADIRIRCEGGMVRLEVKDNGKGIPADLLEPAHDSLGTLGVGLRGMDERVNQLGGNLELLSSAHGTTVVATIPVCQPEH